ncbi:hypothetical protein [Novacetimonas pomaceti]|uniref:hypothetical protein n=1 Tax=Novacetimonas pomaceti TaxID=2021998 RepID=UPI001EF0A941|nr:hypothetical protein [Novacetimonas pomaceti]
MKILASSLFVLTAFAGAPSIALAQTTPPPQPNADSAASAVGKNPPSATDRSGQRIDPSDKLWNNPRTVNEQPGTQPPPNDSTTGAATPNTTGTTGPHTGHSWHGHKRTKYHATTPTQE